MQAGTAKALVTSAAKPAATAAALVPMQVADVTNASAQAVSRPAAVPVSTTVAGMPSSAAAVATAAAVGSDPPGSSSVEGSQAQQNGLRLDLSSEEDPLLCTQRLPSSQGALW